MDDLKKQVLERVDAWGRQNLSLIREKSRQLKSGVEMNRGIILKKVRKFTEVKEKALRDNVKQEIQKLQDTLQSDLDKLRSELSEAETKIEADCASVLSNLEAERKDLTDRATTAVSEVMSHIDNLSEEQLRELLSTGSTSYTVGDQTHLIQLPDLKGVGVLR